MAKNKTIIWQDLDFCQKVFKEMKKNSVYLNDLQVGIMVKYFMIYELSDGDKDINKMRLVFKEKKETIRNKVAEYIKDNPKRVESVMKQIKKSIDENIEPNGKNVKVFFDDSPVIIYKSEAEKIRDIIKLNGFTYNGNKKCEILQKILAVLLVWQKCYDNQHINRCEFAPVIEDKINAVKLFSETGSESGRRVINYQKLIQAGLIEYNVDKPLNPREDPKQIHFLYKIPFISYNEDGLDEEIVRINKFDLIIYQVFSGFDDKIYINQCQKCGDLFHARRPSTKNCDTCNRH